MFASFRLDHATPIAISAALCLLFGPAAAQEQSGLAPLVPAGGKPAATQLTADHDPCTIEVKFAPGSGVRLRDGRFRGTSAELAAIDELLDAFGAERERVLAQSEEWLDAWRARGEARSGRPLHDLNLFYRIHLPAAGLAGSVCDQLNGFSVVEIAYPVGTVSDPAAAVTVLDAAGRRRGLAPDFESQQGYRRAAPLGVDADFGNTFSGGRGEGHVIADVETGWTDDHEDIAHKAENNYIGLSGAPYPWDHGTAVLGELVGEDNDSGVLGLVHQSDVLMSTHQGNAANIPTAVANAAAAVGAGDIVVIEAQCYGTPPGPFPCEYVASTYATVETATANGLHVFAAAGNGNNNLDSAAYGGLFNRSVRDSGSVIVGASDGSSLNKASFSNYGSRLDAHGWGFNVTTAGYGDLFGSPIATQEYTAVFSGTSSATPIVTGAGIILNGIHRECFGSDLDPIVLRDLLAATGTPQGSGGTIGPRPNVRAAIAALGIPTLSLSGTLVPGGTAIATLTATPGDPFTVYFARTLAAVPAHNPPYGYFFLGPALFQANSTIGPAGSGSVMRAIPNNPGLSGKTVGYVQAATTFQSGPGVGSYSNWLPVNIL